MIYSDSGNDNHPAPVSGNEPEIDFFDFSEARFSVIPEQKLCTRCTAPVPGHFWFCPACGGASGEYVTVMPFMNIFAMGDLLRSGVSGPPEKNAGKKFMLILTVLTQYGAFAIFYWLRMSQKAQGKPLIDDPTQPRP